MRNSNNTILIPPEKREGILVIDDEALVRWTLSKILSDAGFAVRCCRDGAEARVALESSHFALMLTDYRLPDTTGSQLADLAHRLSPDTVVLMLSAEDKLQLDAKGNDEHVDAFIRKPFEIDAVLRSVRKHLDPVEPLA
jgi:DNA-binding response OmpR family regulator